jgi:hypothetical protein
MGWLRFHRFGLGLVSGLNAHEIIPSIGKDMFWGLTAILVFAFVYIAEEYLGNLPLFDIGKVLLNLGDGDFGSGRRQERWRILL